MSKIYTENEVIKIISLVQAIKDGETIQTPTAKGGYIDCREITVNDILLYFSNYRIKPKTRYNIQVTNKQLDVIKASLSAFEMANINGTARKLCKNILDNLKTIS